MCSSNLYFAPDVDGLELLFDTFDALEKKMLRLRLAAPTMVFIDSGPFIFASETRLCRIISRQDR